MKQNSKRLTSIVLALLIVAGALLFFFEVLEPEYGNMETIKGQVIGEQSLLSSEQQAVAQAKNIISEYQNQAQANQNLALSLPTGQDLAGAVAQVYGLAQNSSFAIQSLGISTPTLEAPPEDTSSGSGTGDLSSPSSIVKPLGDFSFQIVGAGSYESLKAFLVGLETNIRIFDVQALSITPATGAAATGKSSQQDFFTYAIVAKTYYQAP